MGMLRSMISGGAKAYRDTSNKNIELENKEISERNAAEEKRWLLEATQNWELSKEARMEARSDKEFMRNAKAGAAMSEEKRAHEIAMADRKHKQDMEKQGASDAAAKERTILSKGDGEGGRTKEQRQFLQDELKRDREQMDAINKQLADPMLDESSKQELMARRKYAGQSETANKIRMRKIVGLDGSEEVPLNLKNLVGK